MKSLPEVRGTSLELQSTGVSEKVPDLIALWEQWSTEGAAVLLESAGSPDEANQWLILAGAPESEVFEKDGQTWWKDSSGERPANFDFWEFANRVAHSQSNFRPLPFCLASAWFGVMSYDFGKSFNLKHFHREGENNAKEKKASEKRHGNSSGSIPPDFHFFKPSRVVAFNRQTKETFHFGRGSDVFPEKLPEPRRPFKVQGLKGLSNAADYESMVRRAQDYIAQGDIYQANLSQGFQAQWEGSTGTLYRILRELNPGPFMGLFKAEDFTVVSSSPERLVAGKGDWLETRPIAGTRPRGKGNLEDLQLRVELETHPKEQAEHLMLVDLARNDLGRVSRYGTVEVERYAGVESYARVHHLVSTVRSQKRSDAGISDILMSLFPGGTITGCPKLRCMEIIEELEGCPRGFYTGSMGYLTPGPCFDFNILIRSFTLFGDGLLEFKAGAGIVADSDPAREYMETLYKVEALAQALGTSLVKSES